MTRLTLAMIVKDEAARLPAFLAHHAELYDELVLVDTGSADETAAVAESAGVRVVAHTWQDNYAVARNVGLSAATGDWILFLDADERISQTDFGALRAALTTGAPVVYLQETWNYCRGSSHLEWQPVSGRYPPEEQEQTGMFVARRVGLFPNDERLRFSGRVHESVLPAVTAAGLRVAELKVPVHHYGYVGDESANEARFKRYRRLVQLKLGDDPSDPAAQLEWATVLLESGETEAALAHLAVLGEGQAGLRPVVRGLVLHGRVQRELGAVVKARNLLGKAIGQDPDFIFGWLESIRLEAQVADWVAAEVLLRQAAKRFGALHPQLLREALRIQVKRHQLSAALVSAEELVRTCPHWQEIRELRDRLRRIELNLGEV